MARSLITRIVGGAVIGIVILSLVFSGKETPIETTSVIRQTVTETVRVAGQVEAHAVAELGFQVSGKITSIPAHVGDQVNQGSTLVSLDMGELSADLKNARAEVTIKKSEITNAQKKLDIVRAQQDTLVESAYQAMLSHDLVAEPSDSVTTQTPPIITGKYSGSEGSYKIIIKRLLVGSRITFSTFGIENIRDVKINETGPTPLGTQGLYISFPDGIEDYQNTIWYVHVPNVSSDTYATYRHNYEQALKERERALQEANSYLDEYNGMGSIIQAELDQAQARVDKIISEMNQLVIRAPFEGTISDITKEQGEIVNPGDHVVTLVSEKDFEIVLNVPEIDIAKISVGDSAHIILDAYANEEVSWNGTVTSLSRAETYVDGVPVYQVRVHIENPDERVRSGLSATVEITTQLHENALVIPQEYIEKDGDQFFVQVVLDEHDTHHTEKRLVNVGLRGSDGFVEIIDGLQEAEMVARTL